MKLQLFISHNGGVSRRKAFDHVLAGDVTVNGVVIREPSHMIEPGEDKVALLGREIQPKGYEYVMLNKPAGYVTTCEAQFDQRAVMALLPAELRYLKPVGRLDKDTQGLLLLTNDGELANRLAHPSFDVNKTYHVRVVRRMQLREKDRLEQGVVIESFKTAPAQVANLQFDGDFTEFDLTIHEGHKHQVRLMCHEVGHDVVHLTRVAQGPLKLDLPKPGAWRHLTGEEVLQLRAIGRHPARMEHGARMTRPLFSSNSPLRRKSVERDWHSADTKSAPRQEAPRRDDKDRKHFGGPLSGPKTFGAKKTFGKASSGPRAFGPRPAGAGARPAGKKPYGRSSSGPRASFRPKH